MKIWDKIKHKIDVWLNDEWEVTIYFQAQSLEKATNKGSSTPQLRRYFKRCPRQRVFGYHDVIFKRTQHSEPNGEQCKSTTSSDDISGKRGFDNFGVTEARLVITLVDGGQWSDASI